MLQALAELFFEVILHGLGEWIRGAWLYADKKTDGKFSGCFVIAVSCFLVLLAGYLVFALIRAIV